MDQSGSKHGDGTRTRPLEIDLNEEAPEEGAVTCGTCGKPGGGAGERRGGWQCFGCVLGGGGRRLPDMNAPPPEGESGGADVVRVGAANMCLGSDIFGRSITASITPNFLNLGRSLSLSNASRGAIQIPQLTSENIDSLFKRGPFPPPPPPPTNLNSVLQSQSEVYLRGLREYINQRRGYLSDGWSVDFFYCQNRCKTSAVYCAPDGSRFASMDDVASHLGLQEQQSLLIENINNSFASLQKRLNASLFGNQSFNFSRGNSSRENQNSRSTPYQDQFPVQFEDFFILSSGIIDPRPSYHNISQIFPVGYKSCWHDKITGSIFFSEILEGGDVGPIFRIRRHSCSASPIPVGFTVLSRRNPTAFPEKEKVINNNSSSSNANVVDDDDDDFLSIKMMLNEDIPPNLTEIDFQKTNNSNTDNTVPEELGDCIGEFSVENRSSLLAWETASRSLIHACHVAYKKTGRLRFICKHNTDLVGATQENIQDPLSRFCYISGPIGKIPEQVVNDSEFEACGKLLIKWLQQDRFGLDMEFVQEILEQLPNIHACSGYKFLNKRDQNTGLRTVQSGFLLSKRRSDAFNSQELGGFSLNWKKPRNHYEECGSSKSFPVGKPFSKLPPCLVGDLLQGWEFLWRFSEVLDLEEPFPLEVLENELIHPWVGTLNQAEGSEIEILNWDVTLCTGVALKKAHSSLLKAIVSEVVLKIAAYLDPFSEAGESKSKKGKKKDTESSSEQKMNFDFLQINEVTWPELARRYILVILLLEGNLDFTEINNSVRSKIFHCLQGDGGILCGSLTGIAGMEADASLLAEARKRVFNLPKNHEGFIMDQPKPEPISTPRIIDVNDEELPEWAQVLEPIRKLPTNVGARLKKCVVQALELNPPEWAKRILEHSISREVYKGNASGPTKRAVVSLLSEISSKDVSTKEISSKSLQPKFVQREKSENVKTFSDLVMKQCRIVLRRAAAEDGEKVFCNLLGKTLYPYDNDEEGLLGSSATVSRPLDFRVIDFRLAAGAYAGSHEAFLEDVSEMLSNIRSIYIDRSDLVKLVEKLSRKFKDMYEKEVLVLVQKLPEDHNSPFVMDESKKEMDGLFVQVMESTIPKAPWEDGICKVCGVDKDDDNVLLCDGCDSEYHTYCLNPPLARIPDGNWYCPSCVSGRYKSRGLSRGAVVTRFKKKKIRGEFTQKMMETLSQLAQSMGSKEYWNFNVEERTLLFKFLCDETLNTGILRDHVDNCATISNDLHQKMRFLSTEWKNLKNREEVLRSVLKKSNAPDGSTQGHSNNAEPVVQQIDDGAVNEWNNLSEKSKGNSDKSTIAKKKKKLKVTGTSDLAQEQQQDKDKKESLDAVNDGSPNKSITHGSENNNNGDANTLQANETDVTTLKNEISAIQESISSIESELEKISVRKEFLGRDSVGRIYWGFGRPGTCSLLVDRSLEDPYLNNNFGIFAQNGMDYSPADRFPTTGWISYESDSEISEIVEWLSSGEVRDRDLRESILQWQKDKKNLSHNEKKLSNLILPMDANNACSDISVTKAAAVLEKKYGPCLKGQGQKSNLPNEGKMYRCDCLELIWPLKHHCVLCHKTHLTIEDLEKHYDGNCSKRVEEESRKGKKIVSEPSIMKRSDEKKIGKALKEKNKGISIKSKSQDPECPHDFKEISSKFVTQNSLRELVRGIGLIGSGGIPSFVPRSLGYFDDTALKLATVSEYKSNNGKELKDIFNNFNNFPRSFGNDGGMGTSKVVDLGTSHVDEREHFHIRRHNRGLAGGDNRCVIPESSLRRLNSRESVILRQLQINLLDMESALPEEAVRVSMFQPENRITWRRFVRAAGSIYEMVQATIVLENMIRADYLRREWWYWSSLTAAASISTLSALALRLCTLDAAIIYEKISPDPDFIEISEPDSKENEATPSKSDKGKEKISPSKPSDKQKPKGKNNKRKKDSGS